MSGTTIDLTAPTVIQAVAGAPTIIAGLGVAGAIGDTFSATLTAGAGLLFVAPAAPGVGVVGSGSGTVTLTGDLMSLATALAEITDIEPSAGLDSITVSVSDTAAAYMTPGSATIAVSAAAAPAPSNFVYAGGADGSWTDAADFSPGGVPGAGDLATLPATGVSTTLAGVGAAASLDVVGTYTLTGALGVTGLDAVSQAVLHTASATVAGTATLLLAEWVNTGALTIAAGGEIAIRGGSTFASGGVLIFAGAELALQADATLAVAGMLESAGLLVSLGSLDAGTLSLDAGSEAIAQGVLTLGTLDVAAGALLDGAADIAGAAGASLAVVNDGTIEGAVAAAPLEIEGPVSGTGLLLVDPGGGLALAGAVSAGQTVDLAPGVSPLYIDANGAAGAALFLSDPAAFAGTIEGLAAGDRLFVTPANGDTITAAQLVGDALQLTDAGGTLVAALTLDPSSLPAGATFTLSPNDGTNLTAVLNAPANEVQITVGPAAGEPLLNSSGGFRLPAGSIEPVPLISASDIAGFAAGDTFTMTLTASSGTFTELLSIPLFLKSLIDGLEGVSATSAFATPPTQTFFDPLPLGDGTIDTGLVGEAGSLSVQGSGTGTLTLSGNNLLLLDLQSALVAYQAGASPGNDTVTATFNDGTTTTTTTSDGTITQSGVSADLSWNATGTASALDAANWANAAGGTLLPGVGDSVTLGAGGYAITGDFSAAALDVTGHALTQGAIYVAGGGAGPALTVEGGGIFGSAGFLDVIGDTAIGGQGAGELDIAGIINNIDGNLVIGAAASGYVEASGLLSVRGDILVGVGAAGVLDIAATPVTSAGLDFTGEVDDANAALGVNAGQSGLAVVRGADWGTVGTLTVGVAGFGTLEAQSSTGGSTVSAGTLVLGQEAGSAGTVLIGAPSGTVPQNDDVYIGKLVEVGAGGAGTLVLGATGGLFVGYAGTDADYNLIYTGVVRVGGLNGGAGAFDDFGGSFSAGTVDVGDVANSGGGAGRMLIEGSSFGGGFNVGTVNVGGGGSLEIDGGSGVTGTIDIQAGGTGSFVTSTTYAGLVELDLTGGGFSLDAANLSLQALSVDAGQDLTAAGLIQLVTATGVTSLSGIANSGTITATSGNVLDLYPAVSAPSGSGVLAIQAGATLIEDGAIDATQSIAFQGTGLAGLGAVAGLVGAQPAGTTVVAQHIGGFAVGDTLDLSGTTLTGILGFSGGVLSLSESQSDAPGDVATIEIDFGAGYSAQDFALASDGAYGGPTNDDEVVYVACFASGTRLATQRGEVAVEALLVGDLARTARGEARAIVWIGHRRVACARHKRPFDVAPIRIRPDAFGPGQPHADLWLSPDHAVFVDGVLIPARHLVNGATILREAALDIVYWHVELASHDVLLAEGLPCESYLDTGNRSAFGGCRSVAFGDAAVAMRLPPDFSSDHFSSDHFPRDAGTVWRRRACAPLVEDGAILATVRDRLAAHAEALGRSVPSVLDIDVSAAGVATATVPGNVGIVRLVSASARHDGDRRRLGVLVTGLRVDGIKVPLDDPRLGFGFHDLEIHGATAVRWTDGAATIAVGPAAAKRLVTIEIAAVAAAAGLRAA
jgi:hypothetical protein